MRLRLPLVLLAALAAFAIPAGSALASTATYVAPAANATISQNQTFTVDASGVSGTTQVYFSLDDGAGHPLQHVGDGVETTPGSGIYTWQAAIGGWTDGPYTIDAVAADAFANPLAQASVSVTIDNTLKPLTIAAITPADGSAVSGTFLLSAAPADQNNVVTTGDYSLDYGTTWLPLASDGAGNWTASVDTVAAAVPNGDNYVEVRFADAAGNTVNNSTALLHLVVQNPQAPVITPNTLIADKSQFRAAETQLETGDAVEAYKMEATGFPAPTITYRFVMCDASAVCHDATATDPIVDTSTGLTMGYNYSIQASDLGMHLTVIATATNASGSDSVTTDFGVIAQGYVAPTVTPGTFTAVDSTSSTLQIGDLLQITQAPAYTGGYPTPTINYTWVICQGMNCHTANGLTYTVQAGDAGSDITVYADVFNSKGGDSAMHDFGTTPAPAPAPAPVVAPPAVTPPAVVPPAVIPPAVIPPAARPPLVTPAEQKAIAVARKTVATEKKLVAKAIVAKKAARLKVKAVQKKVDAVIKTVSAGKATPVAKKRLASKVTTLVTTKQVASKKMAKAKARLTKAGVAKSVADRSVTAAQASVVAAQAAVSTGTATASKKRYLAKMRQTLATAKVVAIAKTSSLHAATAQLKVTRKKTSHAVRFARAQVTTVVNAVAAPTAAPVAKKLLVQAETKLVAAKSTAAAKTHSLEAHSTKLKAALKRLAAKKVAALQP